MSQDFIVGISVVLLLFIFCVFLVIFAPKSRNFFKGIEPLDTLAKDAVIKDTAAQLAADSVASQKKAGEKAGEDATWQAKEQASAKITWRPWRSYAQGTVEYLPIYMFSKTNSHNYATFSKLFDRVIQIDGIQSVFFLKIHPQSSIAKHKGWAAVSNKTLRFIYCFDSLCFSEDECGIWVNGESKKLFKDYHYVYDASKEHSIYNNTIDAVVFLIIDFDRPKGISAGYSNNHTTPYAAELANDGLAQPN